MDRISSDQDVLVFLQRAHASRLELRDVAEPSLRLRAGVRSVRWSILLRAGGKRKRLALGEWPAVTVPAAREAAKAARLQGEAGLEKQFPSVRDLLSLYEQRRLTQLRSGRSTGRALTAALKPLMQRQVVSVTRRDIGNEVDGLAQRAPAYANRTLAYLKAFFSWIVAQGYLDHNPAAAIQKPTRERPRERTPNLAELAQIWLAAERLAYPFGYAIQLLMLTAMRRTEVGDMRLTELALPDLGVEGCWTLPAERCKTGRALRVPLTPMARGIIEAAINDPARPASRLLFTTTGDRPVSGWSRAKTRLDALLGAGFEPWRLHDLRRAFATHACDVLSVAPNVADRCLNHVGACSSSMIARVYSRSELYDQRRAALSAWSALIESEVYSLEGTSDRAVGMPEHTGISSGTHGETNRETGETQVRSNGRTGSAREWGSFV